MKSSRLPKLGLTALALASFGLATAQSYNLGVLEQLRAQFNADNQARQTRVQKYAMDTGSATTKEFKGGMWWLYDVAPDGKPLWKTTDNLESSKNTGAFEVWPGGKTGFNLDGSRAKIGVWDSGCDISIGEFGGRLRRGDASGIGDHGMHVSGSIWAAGLNPNAKGMCFNGSGVFYDMSNDDAEIAGEIISGGLMLSNHSYGFLSGWVFGYRGDSKWTWLGDPAVDKVKDSTFGQYSSTARQIDVMLYNAPTYLYVSSAGNKHGDGPTSQPVDHWVWDNGQWTSSSDVRDDQSSYEQIGHDKMAKNMMTVGAIQKFTGAYTGPNSVRASSFGSWGPSDDGRVKPDITAPGVHVFSTVPWGYDWFDGTSMSSPVTTGNLGLIEDQYIKLTGTPARASMLKALAFHTAREAGNAGPDYKYGWGLINSEAACQQIQEGVLNSALMQNVTLHNGETIDIPITARNGQPLRVTANWTDPAGVAQGDVLDDRTARLVNDIDVRIIDTADNSLSLPWLLDPANPGTPATRADNKIDNTEQCQVDNPDGNYIIRITHKGASLQPAGTQVISLVISADIPTGLSDLDVMPTSVIGGVQNSVGTIQLATPPTEALTINLKSSDTTVATVPSVVQANPGDTSVSFTIITKNVRPRNQASVPVTISATSIIGGRSAQLSVLPIGVGSVVLDSTSISGGNTVNGKVYLNAPSPNGGVAVALRSSRAKDARPSRNWIYIPAGSTYGNFTVRTSGVNENSYVDISAVRLGMSSSTTLLVTPPSVSSFTGTPSSLRYGTVKLKITLSGPAGPAGQVFTLSSSDSSILSVPATVKVPAGQKTAEVNAVATNPGSPTPVTVSASRGSTTVTTTITVG